MSAVTVIAYLIGIAIPAFTVYLFVMLDVFGTGKPSTLLLCGAWGAFGAFPLAWLINNTVMDWGMTYETLTRITAPIIEEILKALVLIYLIRQPRFRYIVDGAVYGIAVGIGFALSENLFIYLPGAGNAVLATAISRTLSTSLMHATASGLVGISLGRLRRVSDRRKIFMPLVGIGLAIAVHVGYNNVANELEGAALLLVAIGIGLGGGFIIGWQIDQGLDEEKRRFAETLGLDVGVSTGERKAVQQLGGASIDQIFDELQEFFGQHNVALVRRLLVIQANVGILQNNLSGPSSDRLRAAWEEEIAGYRQEIEQIRKQLGPAVNLFVGSVFPSDDAALQDAFSEELARFDPTLVHTFDMFMRVSELAETFTPEQLAHMAERLNRIEIFHHVSLAHLENLSRAITVQDYPDGHMLFDEGDQGDAMVMLEQGEIAVTVKDASGQDKLLRTFEAGSVVGEFSLLDGQPRSARAQAQGPIRVLMLQREVFYRFIQSRPDVVLAMLQYLADKVRYTTQSVELSVNYMAHIERGDYSTLVRGTPVRPSARKESTPQPDAAISLELDEISAETPRVVGNVFSRAAALLQKRESSFRGEA
jgi:RsiW-degrading membrane proteinase PrsW (M82 family)/CRP-like cAMP-binding protein